MTDRLARTIKAIADAFGLPWDFAEFDHQPTLDDVLVLWDQLGEISGRAVSRWGAAAQAQVREVVEQVRNGFLTATLTTRDGEEVETIPVEGGVCSGLFITALLGYLWNLIVTTMAVMLCVVMGGSLPDELHLKGDDAAPVLRRWVYALLMKIGYQAANAVGGVGKFSIRSGAVEFLR